MSDEDYLICCKYIPGYSLNDKVWCLFEVELVIEVDLCRDAFNCLLLKESYKQMILSLVESHQVEDIGFDDFVQGKGKGLVFLLHGPPGTGKTLTAGKFRVETVYIVLFLILQF